MTPSSSSLNFRRISGFFFPSGRGPPDLLDRVAFFQDLTPDGGQPLDPRDGDLGQGQKPQRKPRRRRVEDDVIEIPVPRIVFSMLVKRAYSSMPGEYLRTEK